ncbi:Uncharacterised protein [Chromobacterium violaceum]|uniref:Uncharacterized protein n=1 Tax=Chromobacterium violaceum TaxID=536 RepID=A0A447TK55_CHRVL|nr:Uncharacterised protein [Chromobacterium violaceum]
MRVGRPPPLPAAARGHGLAGRGGRPARFGWDWPALEQGFFQPLREWADQHDARLKPALAGLLIDALGGDKREHPALLAALEFSHLASFMLDDLANGRDLDASVSDKVSVPLPVWVTIAYNARQLAPVLVLRRAENLAPAARLRLAQRYLFQQSLAPPWICGAPSAGWSMAR